MDRQAAWAAVHDPQTDATTLAAIAASFPEFAAAIAAHPACYPQLTAWASTIVALQRNLTAHDAEARETPTAAPQAKRFATAADNDSALSWPEESDPATPPARVRERVPLMTRLRRWGPVRLGAMGAVILLVVGGGTWAIVAVVQSSQAQQARDDFASARQNVHLDDVELKTSMKQATSTLSKTNVRQLADASTLSTLSDLVKKATAIKTTVPARAQATADIRKQVTALNALASRLERTSGALDSAVADVQSSQRAFVLKQVTPNTTHTFTATDGDGNKETVTITIGDWMKGTDQSTLNEVWKAIGGDGMMPLLTSQDGFTPATAAVVFGTVHIENATPSFPADDFAGGQSWVYLTPLIEDDDYFSQWVPPATEGMGATEQSRQYSSGVQTDPVSGSNPLIRAKMDGNSWGNAPFVIGVDSVFTPNHPNGSPKLADIKFVAGSTAFAQVSGDTSFSVDTSW